MFNLRDLTDFKPKFTIFKHFWAQKMQILGKKAWSFAEIIYFCT